MYHSSQVLVCVLALACACGSSERSDDGDGFRRVKRAQQLKFKPQDFSFIKLQVREGERDGLFGTCIHIPLGDAYQQSYDCDIGITLPIHVYQEQWPRDKEDAARYAARAANAMRKNLVEFEHADSFTCRAYFRQIEAYLKRGDTRQRETWQGANTMRCKDYLHRRLPDFYIRRRQLLIGDYREWSKYVPDS